MLFGILWDGAALPDAPPPPPSTPSTVPGIFMFSWLWEVGTVTPTPEPSDPWVPVIDPPGVWVPVEVV